MTQVGIISDTHSLLRPEAIEALSNVDHILHAGDIGDVAIIRALSEIAPVRAVRGNIDKSPWADEFPAEDAFKIDGCFFYMLHEIGHLDIDPAGGGFQVVVSGHSHKPQIRDDEGVLYVNPGSAGPRRFTLPICLAILDIVGGTPTARIVDLI